MHPSTTEHEPPVKFLVAIESELLRRSTPIVRSGSAPPCAAAGWAAAGRAGWAGRSGWRASVLPTGAARAPHNARAAAAARLPPMTDDTNFIRALLADRRFRTRRRPEISLEVTDSASSGCV